MSLIVPKLCFLQANFEQIYQKHVSRPSWQAFLASGHQIFRANFRTRWTNRQPRMEAKIQQLKIKNSSQGQPPCLPSLSYALFHWKNQAVNVAEC